MGKIILGSSSPRRADILKKMKLDFEIIPSSYVEQHDKADFSYEFVENLAYNKALYVARELQNEDCKVIGADTIVVVDNKILGKPKDYDEAFMMLKELSGRTHFVVSSVSVVNSGDLSSKTQSDTTYVTFENLTSEQIKYYIENYKPYDKAGAYGIQELPDGYIKKVGGAMDNVIGLPSKLVENLLKAE
jgi:septum formation protein